MCSCHRLDGAWAEIGAINEVAAPKCYKLTSLITLSDCPRINDQCRNINRKQPKKSKHYDTHTYLIKKHVIENLNDKKSGTSKTDSRLVLQRGAALDAAAGRRFSNIAIIIPLTPFTILISILIFRDTVKYQYLYCFKDLSTEHQ